MTPHGKANHVVHCSCSPKEGASVRRRTPVECQSYDNLMAMGNRTYYGCGSASQMYKTSRPRSAVRRKVQSTVLRGGVRSWANHWKDARRCQGERFEQSFEETRAPNDCRNSGASSASFGRRKSRTSSSRNARAARSAPRNSTSQATASLPMKRSWSCSTNCGRASGREFLAETRRAAGTFLFKGAVQSSEIEPDERSQDTCGILDFEGSRGRQAGRRDEAVASGAERCERDVRAENGCVDTTLKCRSESNQRQVRSAGKPQGPRKTTVNPGRKVVSRRDCRAAVCARGDEPRATIFSSGDGLGIHQPGSITRGTRAKVKTPSGRARERAMCPAVARSFCEGTRG